MNVEIELPDLGDQAGDHAIVSEWFFEEGDLVEEGEDLLEVVAEGETIAIPSPYTGMLVEKLVEEEDLVRVGDPIAIMEVKEEEELLFEEE